MATTNAQTFTIGGVTHQVEDTTARAGVATLQTALASLQSALDTLMGTDDITDEIDTYNEIKEFLDGFDVNDPNLSERLTTLFTNVNDLMAAMPNKASATQVNNLQTAVTNLQTALAGKVDAVPGKGLSTNDYTNEDKAAVATIANKANSSDVYTKSQTYNKSEVDAKVANAGKVKSVTINGQTKAPNQQTGDIDLGTIPTMQQVEAAIAQAEATIEQQQLTVITGDRLSLWLDEDGESINIMVGEVPDQAAAPTISHVINNDGTATVTITNNEQGATIHYTTDGTAPTESSSVYNTALTIDTAGPHTIKAIAVVQDKMNSSAATDTFSVESCQTPDIEVDNSASNTATVTATAGSGESVSLFVNKGTPNEQSATGTGSASVTINKTTSSQTLPAEATATATRKLSATKTQNVTIEEKAAHVFSAHKLGGKAVAGTTQGDIQVTLNNSFVNQAATITEEDGVIWWEIDCANQVYLGTTLQNEVDRSSSIFSAGAAKILTIEHIPDECTIINNAYVFAGCTALTQFKVGNSGLATFANTLAGNTSLKVVVLPSTVTSLNSGFPGCTALESVTAPGVTEIINNVFSGCSALTTCVLGQLTRIDKEGFKGCSSLNFANVDFGHVGTIGTSAFENCANLKSAVLVSTTVVKSNAFKITGLTSVTLPEGLTTIENTAFYGNAIPSIEIPESVTSIGSQAFQSDNYMKVFHIKKVIASAAEAATVASNGLNAPAKVTAIYVPAGTVEYYQTAWSAYASKIVAETN